MKIAVISDVHIESWDLKPNIHIPNADVYVFDGDVGEKLSGLGFLNANFEGKSCIYVPGNHEYFGANIDDLREELITKTNSFSSGGVFDNQTCFMKIRETNVRFICSTLWSNFSSIPAYFEPDNPFDIRKMEDSVPDFTAIKGFSYKDCIRRYNESVEFITGELEKNFDGVTIVVTHFAPHVLSIAEHYKRSMLTAYYVNDLPTSLISKANYWIHGHTHTCFDYFVGDCRVICQPFGYRYTYDRESGCASTFKIIEI